jgi:YidC/Oxa1 family membrane protein insertase
MKPSKFLPALVLIFALTLTSSGIAYASKADELIRKAEAKTIKGDSAERTVDKNEYYQDALKIYERVSRDYSDTPEGAEALLKAAAINKKLADTYKKDRESHLHGAYETVKRLINTYGKPKEELEEKLTTSEVQEVQAIVALAKERKKQLEKDITEINSQKIQYKILDFFVGLTGRISWFSYWFAVVLITVIIKIIITPLTKRQFQTMKEMQKVAPLIKEVQEKYRGDQKTIGEKTMAIYKEHRINPFASCLPLLIQLPILIFLFNMIRSYEIEFAKGTFLWIGSGLSHRFSINAMMPPGSVVYLTARSLAEPDLILVILYVISMYLSTKISAVDPTQAEQQKMMAVMMPVMFAFLFAGYPSAFLLYWLTFNILQTTQQYFILKSGQQEAAVAQTPPPPPPDDTAEGGSGHRRRRRR